MLRYFLPSYLLLHCVAMLSARQEVTFKNVSLSTQTYNEVNCLAIRFDAYLKYSYNQLLQQGDSTDQYLVEVYLKSDKLIAVTKGYGSYQDPEGKIRNSYALLLSNDVRLFSNITIFIPMAAIDMAADSQWVKPIFKVLDKQNRVISDNISTRAFSINFPPKINLHLSVKEIAVAETDFKNEFWDYFFVDTNVAKPEVCWSVLLASKKINGSPYTKNSYTYTNAEGKDDVEFTISKDDIFYINVYDFDMLSFSDMVGSMRIDMNEMKQFSGTNFTTKFGKVLKMDFVVTIL